MDEHDINRKKTAVPNPLLRNARERRSWSHKNVADRIGLPDAHTVGRWERGVSFPQPHYRQELCRIFEKSPEELGLLRKSSLGKTKRFEIIETDSQSTPMWKIPASFTSFIGRQREIAAVRVLLEQPDVRLVTLLGPGGVGKTRLSMQIAVEMREHFVDGICFVSLATIRDPILVIPGIAKELGIQENAALSLLEQVKMLLHNKRFLLLLDNFEQVATEAPFIEQLLASCSDLKVVITSRTVLHLQGEYEFPVPPLALPELQQLPAPGVLIHQPAIALFVQRAQAVLPDFILAVDNAHTIAEICVRLDGLPLAIELAASRVKIFPPKALLVQLTKSLQILKSETRTVPERQRTLYNTIQWSYDLLNEQEQQLFRLLALFSGGCTIEAIEAILEARQEQITNIVNLVDNSLLQQTERDSERPRFTMLETIREYGLDCLRMHGDLEAYQRAHAMYYLTLLEEAQPHLKDRQQAQWLVRLEQELKNLRAALQYFITHQEVEFALRFCEAFGKFCGLQGYWSEEMRWLDAVLALPEVLGGLAMRAKVLRRAGHLAYRFRDLTKARAWQEKSVEVSQEVGDKQNLAGALSGLGWTLYRQRNATETYSLLRESVKAARASGDQWTIANALESLGRFMHYQGNTTEAHDLLEESVTLARTLGDRESLARILTTSASIELAQHNIEQAATLAREASLCAQELGAKPLIALVLDSLGNVAMFQGEYAQAATLFNERMRLAQDLYDQPTLAVKRLQLATIALIQGDLTQATTLVQESLKFFRERKDHPNIASALHILGNIKRTQRDFSQAIDLYKEALLLDEEVGNTGKIGKHLIGMAMTVMDRGQFHQTASLFGVAASLLNPRSDMYPAQQAEYERALHRIRVQLGEEGFAAAWSKGRVLTVEQALRLLS